MFVSYYEITKSDQDHQYLATVVVTECYRDLPCLPIIVMIKTLIRISHVCPLL